MRLEWQESSLKNRAGSAYRPEDRRRRAVPPRILPQRSPAVAEGRNPVVSGVPWKRATLAVVLAALTAGGCGDDSLPAPPSPTTPRPVVAPSPPSTTHPAPSPTEVRAEPGGTGTVASMPEMAGLEATAPGEESAGSAPPPKPGQPDPETGARDVQPIYTIDSFSATAVSQNSIRVRWSISLDDITYSRDPVISLGRREAPSVSCPPVLLDTALGGEIETG